MADMKHLLLRLGEQLVRKHDFKPSSSFLRQLPAKSTEPILTFLLWLDRTPEARQELENLGYGFLRTLPFSK